MPHQIESLIVNLKRDKPHWGARKIRELLATACGRINVSTVLAGQRIGIKEIDEGVGIVSFMHYDLGDTDLEQEPLQALDNPFGTRLSPMS